MYILSQGCQIFGVRVEQPLSPLPHRYASHAGPPRGSRTLFCIGQMHVDEGSAILMLLALQGPKYYNFSIRIIYFGSDTFPLFHLSPLCESISALSLAVRRIDTASTLDTKTTGCYKSKREGKPWMTASFSVSSLSRLFAIRTSAATSTSRMDSAGQRNSPRIPTDETTAGRRRFTVVILCFPASTRKALRNRRFRIAAGVIFWLSTNQSRRPSHTASQGGPGPSIKLPSTLRSEAKLSL